MVELGGGSATGFEADGRGEERAQQAGREGMRAGQPAVGRSTDPSAHRRHDDAAYGRLHVGGS